MRIKCFLVVSLMLAILAIGAVSAADEFNSSELMDDGELDSVGEIEDGMDLEKLDVNDDESEKQEESVSNDDEKLQDSDIEIRVNPVIVTGEEDGLEDVITGYYENVEGNITVLIDDVQKVNKQLDEYNGQFWVTYQELRVDYGEYNMKVNFVNETGSRLLYDGPFTKTYHIGVNSDVEFDEFSDYVSFYEYAWNFGIKLPYDVKGNLTVSFNGSSKRLSYSRGIAESSIPIEGLGIGEHKIKVSLTDDPKYPDKTIEHSFHVTPAINVPYYVAAGETADITVELPKNYKGTVTVYNQTYHEGYWDDINNEYIDDYYEIDTELGSAVVTDGVAKIPIKNLNLGRNYITVIYDGDEYYRDDDHVIRIVENSPRFSSSISSSNVQVGDAIILKINAPRSDEDLHISVDGRSYKEIPLYGGEITEIINSLGIGEHKISLYFLGESEYYLKSYYVTVREKAQQPDNSPAVKPAAKKDTVKLTLKKVTVKKSAKKLVLQATLKINGKAVKGKVIKFKFNKKTYNAKTNKKGIAKVAVKKAVLKKLKKGKKITYSATYGKTTKKVTVKVKK